MDGGKNEQNIFLMKGADLIWNKEDMILLLSEFITT